MSKRLGITMRIDSSSGEARDCLARDWSLLLQRFQTIDWIMIPNLGEEVLDYIQDWKIEKIVLTGGEDLGTDRVRDLTENRILGFSIENSIPVFGVCRGMQVMQTWFGGKLEPAGDIHRKGRTHEITACCEEGFQVLGTERTRVNSYHSLGFGKALLADELEALALSDDGLVEICRHRQHPLLATQFHPERELPAKSSAFRVLEAFLRDN